MSTSETSSVTIDDIARAAGVSVSTVSRILNNKPDVAADTRQRVQQIIDQAGYQPHAEARRLRTGTVQTRTIALHYPFEDGVFNPVENVLVMMDFITGASRAIDEAEYQLNLITKSLTADQTLDLYRCSQIDGLILMQVEQDDVRVNTLRQTGYPFVMIGRSADNTGLSLVDLIFEDTPLLAFDHLVALGHQHIGFIDFPASLRAIGYGPAVRAAEGYNRAIQKHKLPRLYREVEIKRDSIQQAAHSLLDENPDMTAIVIVHGEYVAGVTEAIYQRNLEIPGDISILIIANQKQAEMVNPALSRVDLPSAFMGYEAARLLMNKMQHPSTQNVQMLIQPQLILQNSTSQK